MSEEEAADIIIARLNEATVSLVMAKAIPCKCAIFTLRFDGGCQCERGRQIKFALEKIEAAIGIKLP